MGTITTTSYYSFKGKTKNSYFKSVIIVGSFVDLLIDNQLDCTLASKSHFL